MKSLLKTVAHNIGQKYLKVTARSEFDDQRERRINERPIEYRFVFDAIAKTRPRTILDVGTGMSALPSLMRTCGPIVSAIDNIHDYWPEGMVNRHYHVIDQDVTRQVEGRFDMVTCISVLEHVKNHDAAVQNMLNALNPGGHLVLTHPYNEKRYVENVYKMAGVAYGSDLPYVCQMYSRDQLDRWFAADTIVAQEYWRVFSGDLWAFGETLLPSRQIKVNETHQLTCLLIRKGA
jgi:2-polyprenyl-3-methyl-5-hydroxy-6-metoxy-1,4-benzoquinol methylase